jgi:hypothetical protein
MPHVPQTRQIYWLNRKAPYQSQHLSSSDRKGKSETNLTGKDFSIKRCWETTVQWILKGAEVSAQIGESPKNRSIIRPSVLRVPRRPRLALLLLKPQRTICLIVSIRGAAYAYKWAIRSPNAQSWTSTTYKTPKNTYTPTNNVYNSLICPNRLLIVRRIICWGWMRMMRTWLRMIVMMRRMTSPARRLAGEVFDRDDSGRLIVYWVFIFLLIFYLFLLIFLLIL